MIEFRFLVRGGEKCLQYRTVIMNGFYAGWSDWQDVPEVSEEGESDDK